VSSLLLVLAVLAIAGCATQPTERARVVSEQYSKEMDGLVLSVQPLTTAEEVRGVFGGNILRDGVLPIRLSTENRNASSSFLIPREKIAVLSDASGATNSLERGATGRTVGSITAGQAVGGFAAAGAGPLLILVAALTAKDTVDPNIEHNLTGKEFFTRTLGPGQRTSGYIYCFYQKEKPPAGHYRVRAEVKNTASGAIFPIEFDVNIQLRNP
jgi:hypothetical protein